MMGPSPIFPLPLSRIVLYQTKQSFWQKEEGHTFDAYGRELAEARAKILAASASASSSSAAPAPVYDDVEYDPTHAAADWAGLVKKRGQKVHFPLTQTSVLVAHPVGGLTDGSSSLSRRRAPNARNSTSFVISGVDAPEPSDWATSYQAQAKGTPTPTEMLDPLRLRPRQKAGTPQQQKDEIEKASKSIMPARQQQEDEGVGNDTLIGYRTPAAFRGKASFLGGMGRKLTEETDMK